MCNIFFLKFYCPMVLYLLMKVKTCRLVIFRSKAVLPYPLSLWNKIITFLLNTQFKTQYKVKKCSHTYSKSISVQYISLYSVQIFNLKYLSLTNKLDRYLKVCHTHSFFFSYLYFITHFQGSIYLFVLYLVRLFVYRFTYSFTHI